MWNLCYSARSAAASSLLPQKRDVKDQWQIQSDSGETLSARTGVQVRRGWEEDGWSGRKAARPSSVIGLLVAMWRWLPQKHLNERDSMNEKEKTSNRGSTSYLTPTHTKHLSCSTDALQWHHRSPSNNIWLNHGGPTGKEGQEPVKRKKVNSILQVKGSTEVERVFPNWE